MRIVLVGKGSFIARAVDKAANIRGIDLLALSHDASLNNLRTDDCVINFSLSPNYRLGPYQLDSDCDLRVARAASRAKSHFILLSTRRVYGPGCRWNAVEGSDAAGDETAYGRNKARTEQAVRETLSGGVGIFRLSNIFGYEYDSALPRKSFFGQMLTSLKRKNTIFFDMHPTTRRDFLPVELVASMLLDRALERTEGTYNLGCGFPLACGHLADWVREGYGDGNLVCTPMEVHDEFYLNMDKWRSRFALPVNENMIHAYCLELGRRLKCEKS